MMKRKSSRLKAPGPVPSKSKQEHEFVPVVPRTTYVNGVARTAWWSRITNREVSKAYGRRLASWFRRHPGGTLYEATGHPAYDPGQKWADTPRAVKKVYKRKVQVVETYDARGRKVFFNPLKKTTVPRERVERIRKFDYRRGIFAVSLYRLTTRKDRVYHLIATECETVLQNPIDISRFEQLLRQEWLPGVVPLITSICAEHSLGANMTMSCAFRHDIYLKGYGRQAEGAVAFMVQMNPRRLTPMGRELAKAMHAYRALLRDYGSIHVHGLQVNLLGFADEKTRALASDRLGVTHRMEG
jgi:hypothetical protein